MKILKWFIVILFWVKSKIVLFVSKRFKRFKWLKSWEYKTAKLVPFWSAIDDSGHSPAFDKYLRDSSDSEDMLEPGLRKLLNEKLRDHAVPYCSDDSSS